MRIYATNCVHQNGLLDRVTLGMLFPRLLQPVLHLASVPVSVETRYALGVGATLMFGWTLLLVWGSAEPIARRGVLLLTVVPVIAGLALANLCGFVNDYIPRSSALYVWSLQGLLVVLLASAYGLALHLGFSSVPLRSEQKGDARTAEDLTTMASGSGPSLRF